MNRPTVAGVFLLAIVLLCAALAPFLAGVTPLLIATPQGMRAPAMRLVFSIIPPAGPAPADSSATIGSRLILAPLLRQDPLAIDLPDRLKPPTRRHRLGTDELGRDVLSRLIHAARPSLLVAFLATAISLALGIPLGAAAGYGRAGWEPIFSRVIEAILSFPSLILALLLAGMMVGSMPPLASVIMVGSAIGFARSGVIARHMRGEVLRLAATDLATSARALGAAPIRVLVRHLVPSGLAPVLTAAAFGAGSAIVAEASLSFLGLGVQPPAPTWGQILSAAATYGPSHWWLIVFPGAAIAMTVMAFNLIGEGLGRR